jgi:hypothetical protein
MPGFSHDRIELAAVSVIVQECAVLLELLNRELPAPLVEYCVALSSGQSPTAGSRRSSGEPIPSLTSSTDTIDEINNQLAVIKKYEKTLRYT